MVIEFTDWLQSHPLSGINDEVVLELLLPN
jgi:hypothetical protein